VSNIAWEQSRLEEHLALLRDLGCDGVEVAPSAVWEEPVAAGEGEVARFKGAVAKYGLQIPAFHALLFTRPDLFLFGDAERRREAAGYLKKLIALAGRLSVGVLVYGSPASRRVGDRPYGECYEIAVGVFRELGREAARCDTCFCIEPLGPSESDFINTSDEGHRLVEDVSERGFGLHLDARAMADAKEDYGAAFGRCGAVMRHFHVGDPGLAPPGYTGFDHGPIGEALKGSAYEGYVSIEMRRGFGDSVQVIRGAVSYVRQKYF
jgi:sugar phosphate isomerase/epimerase